MKQKINLEMAREAQCHLQTGVMTVYNAHETEDKPGDDKRSAMPSPNRCYDCLQCT